MGVFKSSSFPTTACKEGQLKITRSRSSDLFDSQVWKKVLNVNIEKFFKGKAIRTSKIVSVDLRVKTKRGKTASFESALLTPKKRHFNHQCL